MKFSFKKLIFLSIVISGVVLFFFSINAGQAQAQTTQTTSFYVDVGFDINSRSRVTASLFYEAEKAQFFVEDSYWNGLSISSRATALSNLGDMAESFDNVIYPKLRGVFGSEWTPGIDNNPKITILITQMEQDAGGYFREEDEFKIIQVPNSNEREMIYLNTRFLGNVRSMQAFMAHEFQHLIHYNQKNKLRNVKEERWIKEMMSEVAPTIAGLNDNYSGSNLQSRVGTFLSKPSNDLPRWSNSSEDYGVASMFGHYLLNQYGTEFFTKLNQSTKTGKDAISDTLSSLGEAVAFEDVFNNWVLASLINNCNVAPIQTFCYIDANLNYDNLHITFKAGVEGGKRISQTGSSFPWQGNWYSYSTNIETQRPDDNIFVFTFNKAQGAIFSVPYVVYPVFGLPQIFYMTFDGNLGKFYLEDFGFKYNQVVVMPVFQGFINSKALTNYSLIAEISTTIPSDATESIIASENVLVSLPDGAIVRAQGDDRVYITKNTPLGKKYKRWVQSAEIMDMYGHLRWEDIIVVSKEQLDAYQEVTVVRFIGDLRVYFVSLKGQKRWITSEQEFLGLGFTFDMVYEINEREFNFYKTI